MIPFDEARGRLFARISEMRGELDSESVPLADALGRVSARSILAPRDLPPFDNSAMDGFAVRACETAGATPTTPVVFALAGVAHAGDEPGTLPPGRMALEIMTGAPIPVGADAVIAIERARLEAGRVVVTGPAAPGAHVRHAGEDVRRGEEILGAGARIRPAEVGVLAAQGLASVRVTPRPRVSIIATGQELVAAGEDLPVGQIFDSNLPFLSASLAALPVEIRVRRSVRDDPSALRRTMEEAFAESDFLLVTGGVSAGAHDYTRRAFAELGTLELLWRVAQRPGGPLYIGTRGRAVAAGLPGNPFAVVACFYLYIHPALLLWAGAAHPDLPRIRLPLSRTLERDHIRSLFLKGRLVESDNGSLVQVLPKQGSHMTSTLTRADILLRIDPGKNAVREGEIVDAFVLPS